MSIRVTSAAMLLLAGSLGCSPPEASPRPAAEATAQPAVPDSASFVNRVWIVAESEQVAEGELRVFLSEGTLVMAAPHTTPAFGFWRYRGDSLTITEEGRDYPVDIVELTEHAFRIRIRGPGEPVLIRFRPAGPAKGS